MQKLCLETIAIAEANVGSTDVKLMFEPATSVRNIKGFRKTAHRTDPTL